MDINNIHKYRAYVMILVVLFFISVGVSMIAVGSAQSTDAPTEIQDIVEKDSVSEDEKQQVQEWFNQNGDSLSESDQSEIGLWLRNVDVEPDTSITDIDTDTSTTQFNEESQNFDPYEQVEADKWDSLTVHYVEYDHSEDVARVYMSADHPF